MKQKIRLNSEATKNLIKFLQKRLDKFKKLSKPA